jgi:multiple sugar transport system substrate-binding protein
MSRRLVFSLFFLSILVLSIGVSVVGAQDDVQLRWRTRPDNQAEIDLYQSISDSVDEGWDGVSLTYEPGGTEGAGYQATLLTEFGSNQAPDVFWIPGTDIATFAEAGAILNLADIAAAADFDVNAFYPQQVEQLTYNPETGENDALWGLPRDASAMVLYYNADLFDEAGIDYPDVQAENGEWDWEALAESSQAISDLGDDIYGFGMNGWWANWLLFINETGDRYFNEDQTGCGFTENSSQAISFLQDLYASESAVPFGSDAEPPFIAGNVGMFMNGRWATPNMIAQADFNWNVAEVPAGPEGPSNWLFWGAYVVNANTENPEAAFELVTRLTSNEVQSQVTALGANIPSRAGEETVNAFLGSLTDVKADLNNQAWISGLDYAVAEAPLWTANFQDIDAAVGALVGEAINGEVSAEEFPTQACELMAPFFEGA